MKNCNLHEKGVSREDAIDHVHPPGAEFQFRLVPSTATGEPLNPTFTVFLSYLTLL